MRASVTVLVAVGVLILIGYVVVGVELVRRSTSSPDTAKPAAMAPDQPGRLVELGLPTGARIVGMAATSDRVVLQVTQPDMQDRLFILDPRTFLPAGR